MYTGNYNLELHILIPINDHDIHSFIHWPIWNHETYKNKSEVIKLKAQQISMNSTVFSINLSLTLKSRTHSDSFAKAAGSQTLRVCIFSWSEIAPHHVSVSLGFVWALCAAEGCFVATVTTFVNIRPVCGGLDASFLPKSALFLSHLPDKFISVLTERCSWLELLKIKPAFSLELVYLFVILSCHCSTWNNQELYLAVAEHSEEDCVIAFPQLFHCPLVHTTSVSWCVARDVDVERCL